jgi:hypothetical protein
VADLRLAPGHVILIVRVRADQSTVADDVEQRVVDWFADALGVEASRRSQLGEYVIGAANPVTVIPMLDLSSRELADRETALCQGQADAFLGELPPGENAGALVHVDWGGVAATLPTRWTHHFGTGLLAHWAPTEQGETPDLAVTAECLRSERARPPIEPPTLSDELPDLPEVPDIPEVFGSAAAWFGLGLAAVVGFALWQSRKK